MLGALCLGPFGLVTNLGALALLPLDSAQLSGVLGAAHFSATAACR